ncbi:hypothetical protein [Thiorhodococcus drewsii]|uniref:hypothetical protein n=1 Tax=Thiorhodococcus drewsii TaxID=210408 RepID=UPI0002DA9CC8|nr:hypothetical protein [Thiorhodococcus drewsii]
MFSVCIDGLDESEPPDEKGQWPLQILPPEGSVPEGLYLVLTSRPPDADDAPSFLRERIAALYGAEAREVALPGTGEGQGAHLQPSSAGV